MKPINQDTIDEMRNELFIALYTVRKIESSMFEFTHDEKFVSTHLLQPLKRQLENVRTALDKAYSHI